MLKLTNIVKEYQAGDSRVAALKGVSVEFRRNEFVAILGQSGCGKTTLLNIIGGLDHYTGGDLSVNGVSTREYRDADWDAYRNHSIGFVFQSYNLIPHQTVLANVELAMTISGVPKAKRRAMAVDALKKVGLGDQLKKKPNQMSGGQMQRVAIARALVNDPEILLADEPTGALDSETSVQVMEILKEVARDRLVIMVTHNPDLAERYATRTIRLLDGKIVDDTRPYSAPDPETVNTETKKRKKPSMSVFTAFSLSLNNLMTKKTRTILTAFAGSIGIIGIALIWSLSNGIDLFINRMQQDTLSSYPITIQAESMDMSNILLNLMGGSSDGNDSETESEPRDENSVYTSSVMYDLWNSLFSTEAQTNDLKAFREYLNRDNPMSQYLSAVQYRYDFTFDTYVKDSSGKVVASDALSLMQKVYSESIGFDMNQFSQNMPMSSMTVWEELLAAPDGDPVHPLLKEQYDLVAGHWPERAEDVVLVVTENNEVSDLVLCTLGLKTSDELIEITKSAMEGQQVDVSGEKWSFDQICGTKIKLVLPTEGYQYQEAGNQYLDQRSSQAFIDYLYGNDKVGITLSVCGIIRPNGDAMANMLSGSLCYTSELSGILLDRIGQQEMIQKQLADPTVDVISGRPFQVISSEQEKAQAFDEYLSGLSEVQKISVCSRILCIPSEATVASEVEKQMAALTAEQMRELILSAYEQQMGTLSDDVREYIQNMSDTDLSSAVREGIAEQVRIQYGQMMAQQVAVLSPEQILAMFEDLEPTERDRAVWYDTFVAVEFSELTYDEVLKELGYANPESPSAISLYCSSFEDKDKITDLISEYNSGKDEAQQLKYTDYVALVMSSVSIVLNAITYVLIAFVSISLVVSSIMIGIITYISVLERTKEIGILRAIGSSKRDVSRVFNAETLIVGFTAGVIGISLTLLLTIPVNVIIHALSGLTTVNAVLPWWALGLIPGSMFLTFIAGLIPAKIAAKKDPVEALRSE